MRRPVQEPQQKVNPNNLSPAQVIALGLLTSSILFLIAFAFPSPIHAMDHGSHAHHHHAEAATATTGMQDGDMDGGMPMYFMNTWHTTLWFKSWETKTFNAYLLSLVGLVLLGVVHEALACYRSCYLMGGPSGVLQEPLVGVETTSRHTKQRSAMNEKLWASALYAANICSGYMLMLAVMTFNTGYFFAVIGGMGLGYFLLFDQTNRQALTRSESCHVRLDNHPRA